MTKSPKIQVEHARVGRFEVPETEVIRFEGLPGFPEAHRFALLRHAEGSKLAWLACLDDPALAFVVVDPLELFTDYAPVLGPQELAAVGAASLADVCLLAIANLSGESATVNLAAPVLVDAGTRRAAQLVLADERWPVRAPLGVEPQSAPAGRETRMQMSHSLSALSGVQTESNPQT